MIPKTIGKMFKVFFKNRPVQTIWAWNAKDAMLLLTGRAKTPKPIRKTGLPPYWNVCTPMNKKHLRIEEFR